MIENRGEKKGKGGLSKMKEKKKKEGNLVGKVVPDNVKKFGWRLLFVNFFLCM